ncbi:MAG: protein kinase [Candidatus Melainabacteria bacterium]|nr:protein kinase [Candidatus Melainabacteria bacterium]
MSDSPVCPTCLYPKEEKSKGSLTQWIMLCTCDLSRQSPDSGEQTLNIKICSRCGKRVGAGRHGSFTQFIFRFDLCQCDRPEDQAFPVVSDDQEAAPEVLEDGEELPLDPASFPTERYKPLRLLGQGGTGSVYLCRDRLLIKNVAVKILDIRDPRTFVAFQEEARATSRLNHPSIVRIVDFGITGDGAPFMVLEYVDGESLESVLARESRLAWEIACPLIAEVCDALSGAHRAGIYHRDIKPGNILIERGGGKDKGSVRILDWGIAGVGKEGESYSQTLAGTPAYMSPDQAAGRQFDARSEVYSLGCVLFECLAGRPPFEGNSALEVLSMHARDPVPDLSPCLEEAPPPGLAEIIAKALAKDPEERFQSMSEFARALESIRAAPSAPVEPVPAAEPGPENRKGRKTATIVAGALLTITLAAAAAFYLIPIKTPKITSQSAGRKTVQDITPVEHAVLDDQLHSVESLIAPEPGQPVENKWTVERASITGIGVDDADLTFLANPEIFGVSRDLDLKSNTLSGSGLSVLAGRNLGMVTIRAPLFDDRGARELSKTRIAGLRIESGGKLSLKGIKMLLDIDGLRFVGFQHMVLPDGALEAIAARDRLRTVRLHDCKLVNRQVASLIPMKNLRSLSLAYNPVDDGCIGLLAKMKALIDLDINHTSISDKGLLAIAGMRKLRRIELSTGDGITQEGVNAFHKAREDCDIALRGMFGMRSRTDLDDLLLPTTTDPEPRKR